MGGGGSGEFAERCAILFSFERFRARARIAVTAAAIRNVTSYVHTADAATAREAALAAAIMRPIALVLPLLAAAAAQGQPYLYLGPGYIPAGGDIFSASFDLQQAEAWCSTNSSCLGFTFYGTNPLVPNGSVYFKSQTQFQPDGEWQAYARVGQPFVTVEAADGPALFQLNPLTNGCHLDLGYTQQPKALYSQLIYGESFEQGTTNSSDGYAWQTKWAAGGATGTAALDPTVLFNNRSSLMLTVSSSSSSSTAASSSSTVAASAATPPSFGLTNRGLGDEGLFLSGSPSRSFPYDGYVFVLAPQGTSLFLALNDHTTGTLLDGAVFPVPPSSNWQRVNFTLYPSANTTCVGIPVGSDPTIDCGQMGGIGHICVRCGGEFVLALAAGANPAHVGYVFVEPGEWGRFAGLSILKTGVDTLKKMGITAIRAGGSFSNTIKWKAWRGVPWERPSMQESWKNSLLSGFGPFEVIDMANAAGIVPFVTLEWDQDGGGQPSTQTWADLVEYAWGDETTAWGSVRIYNDSHPQPFNVTYFELGNE